MEVRWGNYASLGKWILFLAVCGAVLGPPVANTAAGAIGEPSQDGESVVPLYPGLAQKWESPVA